MRNPKVKRNPSFRKPTINCDPASFDKKEMRFRFDLLDFEHDLWGWRTLTQECFISFFKSVQCFEKMSWAEIKLAAGGKKKGTNHHPLDIAKFSNDAQKRLGELNLEGIGDSLFSLRIKGTTRVYGVRQEEMFSPIWHDIYHGDPHKAAYPVK